jgi:general secretion pathway protein A
MYYQYFGLTEAPFSIAVNPRYLFMSARHRDALAHLLYGVGAGGGFILLTGEVGTGKTTINRCLLEQLPHDTDIAIILNPALNAMELLATVCDELGITYDADNHTLKTLTDKLHGYLLDNHARGRKTVLMIDEAQHLDFEVLEQIRLLTNLETNSEKLLQIILIGQPELAQMLAQPQLRQLNQRITARYNLEPLNQEETGAYIHHRLQVAGMSADRVIFPPRVVRGIYRRTRGIPRLINVLCDRILLGAYGRNKSRADMSMLRQAAQEVIGEESATGEGATWLRPALLAMALLALCAWWVLDAMISRNDVAVLEPVSGEALPANAPAADAAAVAEPPVEVAVPATENAAPEAASEPADDPTGPAPPVWMLSPEDARARLWSLNSSLPQPAEICVRRPLSGPACVEEVAATWDDLQQLDRPLMLDLVTPERFSAAVILLGIEGRQAWVATGQGVERIDLALLGPRWTGRFRFLWHPPAGYSRPLALGDSGEAVSEVAGLFARLDGQSRALAGEQFNSALQQRVRLFQRQEGLDDDGLVGVQTLLRLNERLGIDITADAARARLVRESGEVVLR